MESVALPICVTNFMMFLSVQVSFGEMIGCDNEEVNFYLYYESIYVTFLLNLVLKKFKKWWERLESPAYILFYQRNLMFTILLPLFSTVSHRMVSFSVRGTHYQTKRKMVSLSLIKFLPLQAKFPITHLNFTTFIWYSLVNKCSHSKNLSSLKKF